MMKPITMYKLWVSSFNLKTLKKKNIHNMTQYKNQGDAQMNLLEELSELMQVITKKVRFGGSWLEVPPGHTQSRWESLKAEMNDVLIAYERVLSEEVMKEAQEKLDKANQKLNDLSYSSKYVTSDFNYMIYHPYNGAINHDCERGVYEYVSVYHTNASSLEDAFVKSQNHNSNYNKAGVRSTCVGDIIYSVEDEQAFMVMGRGFAPVPPTVLSFVDWNNHPKVNHKQEEL